MTRRKVAENPLLGADQAASARAANRAWRSATSCREIAEHADELCVIRSLPRRQREPSAVGLSDEHRQHPDGPAQRRQLGRLWPGQREPRPAGVRRPARSRRRTQRRPARLGQRLPARHLSGRHDAARRAAHPAPRARSRNISLPQQRATLDLIARAQPPTTWPRATTTTSSPPASRPTSWPSACSPPRPTSSISRTNRHETLDALRPRPERDRRVRPALPARPPHDRARRALRAGLFGRHQRLGRPQRRPRQPHQATAAPPTSPSPACSTTSSAAACGTTRSSSGAASSAACR